MFLRPPSLRAGSLVAVVAPSSPAHREELFRGLAWLRTRYRLHVPQGVLQRTGYLAGADADRAADLASALSDPAIEAIICSRGGYGAMRILRDVAWADFEKRPKWLVGFSDVTALHAVINGKNICSIHAPNVTGLGRTITPWERYTLLESLEVERAPRAWADLDVIHPGDAEGEVVGGNLALLASMAAAGTLHVPPSSILAIEDIAERPYRIDRMLTSLALGGYLARVSGIVFGSFTQCDPGPDGVTVRDVLADTTRSLGIPVLAGAPFGHGAPNESFILGRRACIRKTTLDWQ